MTANGEVHPLEEATVYVKELDLFVTVKLLEDTPAVLSLGKRRENHGYEWTCGQLPYLIKDGRKIQCHTAITCHSLSRVYRLALPALLHLHLQHRHRRTV